MGAAQDFKQQQDSKAKLKAKGKVYGQQDSSGDDTRWVTIRTEIGSEFLAFFHLTGVAIGGITSERRQSGGRAFALNYFFEGVNYTKWAGDTGEIYKLVSYFKLLFAEIALDKGIDIKYVSETLSGEVYDGNS